MQREYAGGRDFWSANYAPRLTFITDGTSNTLLLGERRALPDGSCPYPFKAWSWLDNGDFVMNDTAAPDPRPDGSPTDWLNGFGSPHPGSINLLMCDGAVRRWPYGQTGLNLLMQRNSGKPKVLPD